MWMHDAMRKSLKNQKPTERQWMNAKMPSIKCANAIVCVVAIILNGIHAVNNL